MTELRMSGADRPDVRRRRRARIISLFVTAVVLGVATASTARAAPSKFVFELCDSALPGGGVPQWSFSANPGVAFAPFVDCASPGGAMGIAQTGQTSATFSFMDVTVPETPGGFVESVTISGISQGMSPGNHFSHIREIGWPSFNSGESQRIFRLRQAASSSWPNDGSFAIVMSCDGNIGPCSGGVLAAHYIAATEVDPAPPSLANLQGSLLGGGVLRGHHGLAVEAGDAGGGLSKVEVLVNGLPAAEPVVGNCNLYRVKNPSYEGTVAATPTPCPAQLKGNWLLDTATFPFRTGANQMQVCATDFSSLSEANRTCTASRTITVDNSCAESPVPGGEVLSAQFVRTHESEVTVPFHTAARVTGELMSNAGDPIRGATICVESKTQGARGRARPVATARTDANGRFSYTVPPGPNRKLLVGYRHDSFQVARAVRYYAHAQPTLRIFPGRVRRGGEILMRGRLPGRRAGGRVVVLQASALHSDRWYTFRRATTNRRGVFHARYRFDATTSTVTYRIRAVVPRQRGYPWEEGHSKPALVEVRGGR